MDSAGRAYSFPPAEVVHALEPAEAQEVFMGTPVLYRCAHLGATVGAQKCGDGGSVWQCGVDGSGA